MRYFLNTSDLQALAILDRMYKLRGFQQSLWSPGVEPCVPASEYLYIDRAALEIMVVDVGNLGLTPRRRLQIARDCDHVIILKVETRNRPARDRISWLLNYSQRLATGVQLDNPVTLRLSHLVGE